MKKSVYFRLGGQYDPILQNKLSKYMSIYYEYYLDLSAGPTLER